MGPTVCRTTLNAFLLIADDVGLGKTVEAGLVVIDEVQRLPGLFQTLRVLVDEPGTRPGPRPPRRARSSTR